MNTTNNLPSTPPRLMNAVVAGFNIVANNIALILLPILVDLFLWLGPHFRLKTLLMPAVEDATRYLLQVNNTDMAARMQSVGEVWGELLNRFNLASLVRTLPIGVPSLMATRAPVATPFGEPVVIEIPTLLAATGLWLVILLVGFLLGCLFFNQLARRTNENPPPFEMKVFFQQALHSLALTLGLLIALIVLSLPALLIVSIVSMVNPGLADIAMLFMLFVGLWLVIPIVFTPHGIFSGQRNLILSFLTSVRLVRFFLPGTGLFLLIAVLIGQGLDILWRIPPENSWFTLVGIFGHAFIYTSLFAASFVYFRLGLRWMLANMQQQQPSGVKA